MFFSWCGVFYLVSAGFFPSLLGFYQISSRPSTLWWLALFIEALGLFPNNEWEGRQQLAILKGNI